MREKREMKSEGDNDERKEDEDIDIFEQRLDSTLEPAKENIHEKRQWFYLPHPDPDLERDFLNFCETRSRNGTERRYVHYTKNDNSDPLRRHYDPREELRRIKSGTLYIVAHGRLSTTAHVCFNEADQYESTGVPPMRWTMFTPLEVVLTTLFFGFRPNADVKIKLISCWGGLPRGSRFWQQQLPLAGLFYAAFRKYGFADVEIFGYEGSMQIRPPSDPGAKILKEGLSRFTVSRHDFMKAANNMENKPRQRVKGGYLVLARDHRKSFDNHWYNANRNNLPDEYKAESPITYLFSRS